MVIYGTEHRGLAGLGTLGAMNQSVAQLKKHRPWYEVARTLLKEKGMKYADLAAILDVTTGTVGHWMVGRREPTLEQIKQIAKVVDKSVSELAGEDFYFLTDGTEREVINAWRSLTPEQRMLLLGMLKSAGKENPAK